MRFRRTIVETVVYTEEVSADSPEDAARATLHVKSSVRINDASPDAIRSFEALIAKSAAVAKVEALP